MKDQDTIRNNHVVSWHEVHRDTKYLAQTLHPLGPWKGLIAVTRGGLVPAAIVARELNIRLIDTICVSSYVNETEQAELHVLKEVQAASEDGGKGWLVIDDLVDTGSTAKLTREMLPNAHIATIYAKPQGKPYVDTYIQEVPQDTWVFFPWDVDLRFVEPLATD